VADPPAAPLAFGGGRFVVFAQDRPDDLPADQQRLAGHAVRQRPADPTGQQPRPGLAAPGAPRGPHRHARPPPRPPAPTRPLPPWRHPASGPRPATGGAASSRSALLLRLRTVTWLPSIDRS